ncbi:MAG: dienelactone hydrolase family protein, partial [Acidimicrobiales bacterium]
MAISTRTDQVTAPDGDRFAVHLFVPDEGGPGIVLLQEIWGVSEFLKAKATLLAGLGYAVSCPDVFWRVERNVSLAHDDEGLARGFELNTRFAEIPAEVTAGDLLAALAHLRAAPEVTGRAGVLGYCLGGRLAYEVAVAG